MVLLSLILRAKPRQFRYSNFVDSVRIFVKGGTGGTGLPKYGGVGGKGGDVYVVATPDQTLKQLIDKCPTKRFAASVGGHSKVRYILGEPGSDCYIEVPIGVSVLTEHKRQLGDLNIEKSTILVAQGGAGGCPENQYSGQKGQAHSIVLDLKLIADVGFVGFPNAGKSTLLTAISRATPKVASYPFTTVTPTIGIVEFEDHRQISFADLPGLIEGAHYNLGMGHKFLKHVERTKLLMFVVDVNGFQLSHKYPFRNAFETVVLLNKELELYKEELLNKPAVLVVNKMDTEFADSNLENLMDKLDNLAEAIQEFPAELRPNRAVKFDAVLPISAAKKISIGNVRDEVRRLLDLNADLNLEEKSSRA